MIELLSHTDSTTETGFTKSDSCLMLSVNGHTRRKVIAPNSTARLDNFTCVEPSDGNHGPVRVYKDYYLQYADGTPYHQFGTTCYAWAHQGDTMEEQTLKTLAEAPFNKMRMCIFPKDYVYNKNEPVYYPFEGAPLKDWDFTKFNPEFWHHFEQRVQDLLGPRY